MVSQIVDDVRGVVVDSLDHNNEVEVDSEEEVDQDRHNHENPSHIRHIRRWRR